LKFNSSVNLISQLFHSQVESRYHKTYTFLVNSVNLRKDELKTSAAAFELIDELEKYAMDNKQAQLDDLKKLSMLSRDVFGVDKTESFYADNIFIFQSFEKMKSDIVDLVKDLKTKEDPVAMINEIDKKILVIESTEDIRQTHENVHEIIPVIENEPPKFLRYLESAEVIEGDKFIFECVVRGCPEPSIQWLKFNSPLFDSPSYKVSYSGGKCRLEIPSIALSDAAVFSCIASNVAGTSQTTANLIVKQREEIKLMPPSFLRLLQNAYTNEKSSFEFNCLVTGNPLPTVQWFKNELCIDNDMSYNITYNNGNAILRIPSVRAEDQGVFTVKASNQVGRNECSAILSVEGKFSRLF
jgi:Immunoglobulin I-set domain